MAASQSYREIKLTIQSRLEELRLVSDAIDSLFTNADSVDESSVYNIKLAVHETCSNIIEHAYGCQSGEPITIWMKLTAAPEGRMSVVVRDHGQEFSGTSQIPSDDLMDHGDGGYGLFLTHALMDQVEYTRVGPENIWRLAKTVESCHLL